MTEATGTPKENGSLGTVTFKELVEFAKSDVSCCNDCSVSNRQFCFSRPVTLCRRVKEQYDWINNQKQAESKKI